jgi:hypothetical protein
MLIDVEPREIQVAVLFGRIDDRERADEHDQKRRIKRPALTAAHQHAAWRVGERGWNQQHAQDMQRVGERRRVLVRVRSVHAEEAAAVGAEVLDRLEARHRAHQDVLLHAFQRGRHGFAGKRLRHALP